MKTTKLLLATCCFFSTLGSIANIPIDFNQRQANQQIDNVLLLDSNTVTNRFIKLSPEDKILSTNQLVWLKKVLNVSKGEDFELVKTESDRIGFTHYRYQQTFHGIPVENGIFNIHVQNKYVRSANGEYYPNISLNSFQANITSSRAIEIAKNSIQGNEGEWNDDIVASPSLVIVAGQNLKYKLAYKTDIYSRSPLIRRYIFVDAQSGEIIKEIDRIHVSDTVGTAVTAYSGTKSITADSYAGSFRLRETGRGNGINTWDLNTSTYYPSAVDFTDADNYWDVTTNQDNAALDAHWGAEMTYDYYFNNYGRNSFDNAGAVLNSYVHYDYGYVNAFWDGTQMTYGDGDGTTHFAFTSLDIVAHEITHAVTEYTANLNYSYESGALNESFSDIFGIAVDFEANPGTANYLMGEQISSTNTPSRSMSNPNLFDDPDTYLGNFWYIGSYDNGGVHTNSGVQNHWFYLLVNGGTGTNDIGSSFVVNGIGMNAAAAITYRNLSVYLSANSQYADARFYAIQSAIDLYGTCSPEVIATTNAWYAVGVGSVYSNTVTANFFASSNFSCVSPSTINFTNTSINGSTYAWDFGDGSTSTATNPSHTYTSTGTYTVTLITTGTSVCNTIDTLIQTNYITITNSGGPVSAVCGVSATNPSSSQGITNVTYNTIYNSSGYSLGENYMDFSCSHQTTVTAGVSYTLAFSTGYEYGYAWIDINNNGDLSASELIYSSAIKQTGHSVTFMIPGTAVTNVPLRLRVGSSYTLLASSCAIPYYGQYEDYSVNVLPNTLPPSVGFIADNVVMNVGQVVNFTDLTQNLPSSWMWEFIGATPSSSTLQNPSVTYNALGVYPVKLVATNSFGSDSLTMQAYISVVNDLNMCSVTSTSAANGILYDSGGPTGSYSDGENCSFLINPGCSTSGITLTFNSFYLEGCCDYFRAYDGVDISGTLLMSANGSSLPPPVTAYSGSMFITFTSDGSVTYPGWEAAWNSTISTSVPVADFSISDTSPPLNVPVQFTDLTTNNPGAWFWDFGDGNNSILQNPTHSYVSPGIYIVTLISDNCFLTDTVSYSLSVQNAPIFNVTPNQVVGTAYCGDSVNVALYIYNTGSGDLVYDMEVYGSTSNAAPEVLALTYGVDLATEYPNTIAAIDQYYTNYNLSEINTTIASVFQTALDGKDILLIPEQENGNASVFTDFAPSIQTFADNGGTVIFCGSNGSYSAAIFNTGLFTGNYVQYTNSATLTLVNPGHELANGVVPPIIASNATNVYNITNPDAVNIVEYNGYPVVTYRPYGSGKAILVGYDFYETNPNSSRIIANAIEWGGINLTNWISSSPITDTISASDTSFVVLTLSATNLYAGTHYDTITIISNDPTNSPTYLPVEFTVNGQPLISLSPSIFNFGPVQVGAIVTDTLHINNLGCDTLDIYSFLPTNGSFTVSASNMQIPPFENDTVYLFYSPDTIAVYADTIFVNSNDTLAYVLVSGIGLGAPVISSNPASIIDTLFGCSDSMIIPVTVYNTGQGTLNTTVELSGGQTTGGGSFFDGFEDGTYNNWVANGTSANFQVVNTNPASGSNCLLIIGSSSYDLVHEFTPEQIEYASVKLRSDDISGYSNYVFFGNSIVNYGICYIRHYGANQYQVYGGTSYNHYLTSSTEWTHFELMNIDFITHTFDLYINGILVQPGMAFYNNTLSDASWVSLYNYDNYYAGYYDDIQIGQQLIPEWLSASVDTLNVNVADSSVFNVTLNSTGLISGTYHSNVVFNSNDPVIPSDTIPVTMVVQGMPEIISDVSCINYGSVMQFLSVTDSVWIYNPGCDTLLIGSIAPNTTDYTTNVSTFNIPPFDSSAVYVTMNDATIGVNTDTLWISSNAGNLTICLTAIIEEAPIISTNPSSFNISLDACDDSIVIPTTIYNTGGSDLIFNIPSTQGMGIPLDSVLGRINNSYASITALVPDIHNFDDGITGTYISDGGDDMYDGGNYLNTNYYTYIPYSDNLIVPHIAAGNSGKYFTRKNTGLFVFAADIDNVSTFNITGNLGADGSGNADGTVLTSTIDGTVFKGYVTRVYNTWNPSINHLVIVEESGSVSHTYLSTTSYEDHLISGLYNSTRIYYLLYASLGGYYVTNSETQAIMDEFLHVITTGSGGIANPNNGTVTSMDSSVVDFTFYSHGISGGTYNSNVAINSNDPQNPQFLIPYTLTISYDPCPDFSYNIPNACNGVVHFMDETFNGPTSWLWDFGDGTTSTQQHPVHTYSTSGNFTVQLIACNSSSCDTVSYVLSGVSVNGPVTASCTPASYYSYTNYDISNVSFNTINNSSLGSTIGYEDFTCSSSTNLIVGTNYPVSVTTIGSYNQNIRLWIDMNNNGSFETTEILFETLDSPSPHTGSITIPTTVTMGVPLRMRVACDRFSYAVPEPCLDVYYGEFEDYTVVLESNTLPPNASIYYNVMDECQGMVHFVDMSTNLPTQWFWDFDDGTTSTFQSPYHLFATAGSYSITLTASNIFGSDTYSQTIAINPLNSGIEVLSLTYLNQPIQFEAVAPGATSWQWVFGDGSTSSVQDPVHTYTAVGTYIVSLTVMNGNGCTSMAFDTLYVTPLGIDELAYGFDIYPNPNSGTLFIVNNKKIPVLDITIVDELGKEVFHFDYSNIHFETKKIVLPNISNGVYFVHVEFEDGQIIKRKFVIQK